MKRLAVSLAIFLSMLLPTSGALSGCSWIFVKPLPPHYRPGDRTDCTINQTAPTLDILVGLGNLWFGAYLLEQDKFKGIGATVFVDFVAASVWISSAIYGSRATSACAEARADDDPAP
jgi:hypothetical protein